MRSAFIGERQLAITAVVIAAAACHTPANPSSGPVMSCAASVSAQSPSGTAVTVTFGMPTVTGGIAPVTTTCAPASGSSFSVGTTSVICTATDAQSQRATCGLSVTVIRSPQLSATSYTAFGDSVTEGLLESCPGAPLTMVQQRLADLAVPSFRPPQETPTSYPYKLRDELRVRYTAQTFVVTNQGLGGETTAQGLAALQGVLNIDQPRVLLLLEGANDINGIPSGSDGTAAISQLVNNLRAMIQTAKARGILVFVGTLLPQREGACRAFAPASVAPANTRIRAMAASEGVTLVDLYAAFGGVAGDFIGPDGLHPSASGYQAIADAYFAAIRSGLELPQ